MLTIKKINFYRELGNTAWYMKSKPTWVGNGLTQTTAKL